MIIHAPGSRVRLSLPDISAQDPDPVPGVVLAACIRGDAVTYECAWWSDRTRNTAWLDASEVFYHEDETHEQLQIGFHQIAT